MTDSAPTSPEPRYRLIPGTGVMKLGSSYFLYDKSAESSPIVFIPTQRIRKRVHDLLQTILEKMPPGEGWPLERIVDLFEDPADRRSVPTLAKVGYLEVVGDGGVGDGGPPDRREASPEGTRTVPGAPVPPPPATIEAEDGELPFDLSDPRSLEAFDEKNRRHFFREATFFHVPREVDDGDVDVGLLGLPFSSVPHSIGTELGPAYLRLVTQAAGTWHQIHRQGVYTEITLDEGLPAVLGRGITIKDFGDLQLARRTVGDLMEAAEACVTDLLDRRIRPLFIGGDHALTFPLVHAFTRRHPDLALIQLDAHNDLFYASNVWYNHAAMVSNLLVYSGLKSVHSFGLRTHFDPRTRNVEGIARHPGALRDRIHLHSISSFRRLLADPAAFRDVLRAIGDRPCYLTVDLDVLSPGEIGSRLSTPAGPGLSWDELFEAVHHITTELDVVGADIMELNVLRGDRPEENPMNPAFLVLLLIQGLTEGRRRAEAG